MRQSKNCYNTAFNNLIHITFEQLIVIAHRFIIQNRPFNEAAGRLGPYFYIFGYSGRMDDNN